MREDRADDSASLVDRLQAGEGRAFEELVRTFQHRVFSVAFRMLGSGTEAEEVAQEVFLRAYRGLAEFRREAKLSTWLYTITSRLCLSRLEAGERRLVRHGDEALANLRNGQADPLSALEQGELEAALHRAIAELPDDRRVVVILRDLEGLAYEEIAETLGLALGTVRSRLHRARLDLKEKLERFFP